jgi:glycosyltransferase involved in cell wall biosynthesis
MNPSPKVSVLMPTYNHEAYIAQAVTSALSQQTNFPFEVVVGEDCSTDGTRKILFELQQAHSQTLRVLLHERNIGGPRNVAAIFAACRGQYVAMLEGDDYWTHPLKLQKQVDLLDAHPEWAICFHPTRVVQEDSSQPAHFYPESWSQEVATIEDLFRGNFMSTCSVVFRNRLFGEIPAWHSEIIPGDWALHILNADRGQIGYLNAVLADYRVHSRGMWSNKDRIAREVETLRMFSRIDHHFGGKYARQIDEYRIRLVTSLLTWLDDANQKLARPSNAKSPSPATSNRSPVYRFGRAVMRPLEQIGRRCGAALGLRKRAA